MISNANNIENVCKKGENMTNIVGINQHNNICMQGGKDIFYYKISVYINVCIK